MTRFCKMLRHFRRNEDGTMVVPFALWTSVFLLLIVSTIELGTMTVRQTVMERAVDTTMRDLKIGKLPGDIVTLKDAICDDAEILPSCRENLFLEMTRLDMEDWQQPSPNANCVDTGTVAMPHRSFRQGPAHEVMLVRACFKYKPITPLGGFNASLAKDANGYTALVSSSAFVNEPL
ncbi:hypothetical protein FIU97_05000 [Roseivivax sp. THAF40]|uniref:TadE/TadG family type IV pilus assembly protein n=1 Tax=unclassified Roseivivax TaxID=2639302 RepID=UPI0012693B85|nr:MULTISPECIES: pilus assembly protein [unclassified Roseivivax]QFS82130.1 hypothetical protein FIV09_04740 [Roseivivax sp. THAF197b]QFT45930.1 hypothetical protein FIU97_05000 [Roseivivax sp. THAF40]